ncbi:type II toxin-antitoxin system RelE family toxin [Fusobacterium ulcerans]|uniref:type II toxin-antitoxin system RelE family toxin n=1 Tax=Fusobacterium ulcerans TaxID=861 RepID=UPI00241EFBE3|nr:type II toxin-antitoxin system RelE/ParE family toxin [Fusobacterium ulcerans]
MKKYQVEFSNTAKKELKKLDISVQKTLLKWINKNLMDCDNPYIHGKVLVGNLKGYWRYRVGNYRLICNVEDDVLVILIVEIGHRSEIYK